MRNCRTLFPMRLVESLRIAKSSDRLHISRVMMEMLQAICVPAERPDPHARQNKPYVASMRGHQPDKTVGPAASRTLVETSRSPGNNRRQLHIIQPPRRNPANLYRTE